MASEVFFPLFQKKRKSVNKDASQTTGETYAMCQEEEEQLRKPDKVGHDHTEQHKGSTAHSELT